MNDERAQRSATNFSCPPDFYDPVIEVYKKDVDRSLLRENLKLSPEQRLLKFARNMQMILALQRAGREHRAEQPKTNT